MKYSLFYAGYNISTGIEQVGILQSQDLNNWSKIFSKPLVSISVVDGYTNAQTSNPCVLLVDGLYRMWYQAKSNDGIFYIMYAESSDLLKWKFCSDPVLSIGEGEGFRFGIQHPHVIFDENKYKMWFTITRNRKSNFGYAESRDGKKWEIIEENVLAPDKKWEGENLLYPMIIKHNDVYKMWYTARSSNHMFSVGYASSRDGLIWSKNDMPVVKKTNIPRIIRRGFEFVCKILGFELKIPLNGIASPYVWIEDECFNMIVHSIGTHGKLFISRYSSPDGKNWNLIKKDILSKCELSDWDNYFQGDPYLYVQ